MSPEMKSYIEELKANGDFLEEGWARFKMSQLKAGVLVALCFSLLFGIVGSIEIAGLVFIILGCFWMSLYSFFAKPHLLHNDGEIAVGIVTSSSYHWLISPFSLGWSFMYEFAHNGKKYVGHKTLTKGKYYHFSGGVLPTEGAEIVVFF